MLVLELPTSAIALAARGHWSSAWPQVEPGFAEAVRSGSCATLLWLHELCLRLGLDVRRRWLGRTLQTRFGDLGRVRATALLDLIRRGRLVDAWYAARAPLPANAALEDRVAWLLAQARIRHELRDLDVAAALLDEAGALAPEEPAVLVERVWMLQSADRLADALALCASGQARFPDHAPLALAECWIRHDANTPDLAAHLAAARERLRSPYLDSLHANLAYEGGDLRTAQAIWLDLLAQGWHERRSRTSWRFALIRVSRELGDDASALEHALAAGPAGATFADRLRRHLAQPTPPPGTRVVLAVPFVRQDHLTCSPATMASLLAWFRVAVDQREIAAQITWDGTASHDELRWARDRGFVVRFFQFDPNVARALLDLGLPFAVSTRFETSGHRQAVVGYDRVLQTFLLRDPTGHYRREVDAGWLTDMMARGGDCALLLPESVAATIQLPPLPAEAELLEWLQLRLDLDERRLAGVTERTEALLARTSGPLRFEIETRTLDERGERNRLVELYRQAHAKAPHDAYWQYRYVGELLQQDRWQEARAVLERVVPTSHSPFLRRLLADQWSHDARTRPAAHAMMVRALRALGRDPRTWHRHASLVWEEDRREEATELYRTAAMLGPTDEWFAESYFRALQGTGRVDAGLAWLRARADAAGGKSSAPASTLADALEALHRPDDAIAVLRGALAQDDTPALRDRTVQLLLRHHRHAEAEALLAERDRFRPVDHAMGRWALARARGDTAAVGAALRDAVAVMPTHVDAQIALLEHVLAEDGLAAAVARTDTLIAEHHDHPVLVVEVVTFLERLDEHTRVEQHLRRLVADHPHQHWLKGRLARHLLARGQLDEAQTILDELKAALPRSTAIWVDLAELARARGQLDATRAAARRALELAPGNVWPLRLLVNVAADHDDAVAQLRWTLGLLLERPHAPTARELEGLVELVKPLPAGEFDDWLQRLAANFPATSAVHVTRCEHLLRSSPQKALPIAEQLVAREPWRTEHHLLLARCLRACNRRADERQALEALLVVDPSCARAFVEIGDSFDEAGRLPQAIAAFERGLARHPGYAVLHGMLADACWRLGDRERALASAQRACELDPSYVWAFDARVRWLGELGRHGEALAITAAQVRAHPHWISGHELHAKALAAVGRHAERVESLRQALALSPRLGSMRLGLLDALISLKRLDEARAVIAEGRALLGDDPALQLRELQIARTEGRITESTDGLLAMLQRHPTYENGWRRYLQWCEEEGRHDDVLALYREPPEALREEPALYGYAGEALRERGDAAGAEQAFERALAMDQGYQWARDQLCEALLARGQGRRVLELVPDHDTPDKLAWDQAVLVAKAAAQTGELDLAERTFLRLLRDESGRGMALAEVDTLLRARHGDAHARALAAAVRTAPPDGPVALQWLRVLAARRRWRRFWRGVDAAHAARPSGAGLLPLARVFNDVRRQQRVRGLAAWVEDNLQPPIGDTRVAGELMHALTDGKRAQRQLVRLFGNDWRRPDMEGWMLANLSGALVALGELDQAAVVSRHALDHLPHDHSYWWHRRDLAEVEFRRGNYAAVRALSHMPVAEYATVRLSMHQLDLAATLHLTPWWRRGRVLRERLPRAFQLRDQARAKEPRGKRSLRPARLFRARPGLMTLLLFLGRPGRRVVRWWLRG